MKYILLLLVGGWLLFMMMPLSAQTSSVYIEEAEVKPYLKIAEEYEKVGKWREAIEQYQFILKKYPAGVCPIKPDGLGSSLVRYVGVKCYYLEKLRQYPPEGKQAYGQLFDTTSAALFEYAVKERAEEVLKRIVEDIFFAEYGDEAAYLLGEILVERDELGNALKYWNNIIDSYPATNLSVTALRAKVDLIYKALSNKIVCTGTGSWPTLGGNNAHNLVINSDTTNERKGWHADLDLSELGVNRPLFTKFALFPCIAQGIIYINNGTNLRALDLKTGKFIQAYPPRWQETVAHYRNLITSNTSGASHIVFGCTLAASGGNEVLYANFLDGARRTNVPGMAGYLAYLAAIDRQTFRHLWSSQYIADDVFSQITLLAPPLVYADKVLTAGVKVTGVETQVYVGCFDSRDGSLLWRRFICARTLSAPGFQPYQPVDIPLLAEANGLLVCLTNQGVIATLDASNGEIIWLIDYSKDEVSQVRAPQAQADKDLNYPIIKGDTLICLPLHGTKIYGLNLYNGNLRWEKPGIYGGILLGLNDDSLFVQGDNISVVNIATGKTLLNPETRLFKNIPIFGRGCVGKKYIYLPCAQGLMRIDQATLKVLDNPPVAWLDPKDVPGNLLILDEQLIGMSPLRGCLYSGFELPK
jgi:tetratricopeptide (TPR) repeat protein